MTKTTVFVLALVGVMLGPVSAAELSMDDEFPVVGQDREVSVSGVERPEDLVLWVVHSPTSETQTEEEIGRFSADGTVTWSPSRFGIATLSARDAGGRVVAAENAAILFAETPAAGVLVMFFAGVLLFGGAAYSLRSVLASGVPDQAPPIDT